MSIRYSERLSEAGIEASVVSVGDAYHNAMTGTVIGFYLPRVSGCTLLGNTVWPRELD